MKRSDWIFLTVAAAMAVAIWYLFVRPKAPLAAPGSSKALADQSLVVGSGLVQPDASDFAAGHYNVDYSQVAY